MDTESNVAAAADEVEPTTNSAFQQHRNRKLASMAMHATSKAPWDSAANFKAAITEQLTGRVCVLVATGEFDPNLVAKEGGSRACPAPRGHSCVVLQARSGSDADTDPAGQKKPKVTSESPEQGPQWAKRQGKCVQCGRSIGQRFGRSQPEPN